MIRYNFHYNILDNDFSNRSGSEVHVIPRNAARPGF